MIRLNSRKVGPIKMRQSSGRLILYKCNDKYGEPEVKNSDPESSSLQNFICFNYSRK